MTHSTPSRRSFVQAATLTTAGVWLGLGDAAAAQSRSPNEKLNVAIVGTGGRGARNLAPIAKTENIVALCDVDQRKLAQAAEQHPAAKQYADYRKLLEQNSIDAVVISTPDHTHVNISLAAMALGKHVYCEKPLANNIRDARAMAEAAKRAGVVTQMGNQNHAADRLRQVVEALQAGVLGRVDRVTAFCQKILPHSGTTLPTQAQPVPAYLDWDLWLGPAPERPYHAVYHPFNWRVFWGLGAGNFADMGCHILDAPYWGLGLTSPTVIEAEGPSPDEHVAPKGIQVRYTFARDEDQPPLEVVWRDGEYAPAGSIAEGVSDGVVAVGERGKLIFNFRGGATQWLAHDGAEPLELPEPTLPRPQSHHQEWTDACKGRGRALSDFAYGAALTEMILAGVVAYRVGKRLEWDGPAMRATNCPEAEALIHPPQRDGWID